MKTFGLLLCLWLTAAAGRTFWMVETADNILAIKESQIAPALIGAVPTDPHEFPFHVSLQIYKDGQWSHHCGGSIIISADKILTAAHCVSASKAKDFLVIAGDHNLQKEDKTDNEEAVTVKSITIHPYFSLWKSMDFDYAILHLLSKLSLNDNVKAIPSPSSEFEPIGNCVTVGWGMIKVMMRPCPFRMFCTKLFDRLSLDRSAGECSKITLYKLQVKWFVLVMTDEGLVLVTVGGVLWCAKELSLELFPGVQIHVHRLNIQVFFQTWLQFVLNFNTTQYFIADLFHWNIL